MNEQPLRREPRQERAQKRIEQILDAAADLLAEVGYEAVTTNAIAERADTAIGSLYQFFRDKGAVVQALADRYLGQLRDLYDTVLTEETARLPWEQVYERAIGALADFHRAHPGFRTLFFGSPIWSQAAQAARKLHQECIGRVERMITVRMPELDPIRRNLLARVNFEVIKALLPMTEVSDEEQRQRVLREIETLLVRYMRGEESNRGMKELG
jgi:AcrR family transcriptional regulator